MLEKDEKVEKKKTAEDSLVQAVKRFFIIMYLPKKITTEDLLVEILKKYPELPAQIKRHAPKIFQELKSIMKIEKLNSLLIDFHRLSSSKCKKASQEQILAIQKYPAEYVNKFRIRMDFFSGTASGKFHKVAELIGRNPSLLHEKYMGMTGLMYAIKDQRVNIVQLFLETASADLINAIDDNGCSALHHAAEHPNVGMLELLLNDPSISPALQNLQGNLPLHTAVIDGNIKHAELLLGKMSAEQIGIANSNSDTALNIAVYKSNRELVRILLIAMGPTLTLDKLESSLLYSLKNGNVEIVELLLAAMDENQIEYTGASPYSLFQLAQNHREVIELLLSNAAINQSMRQYGDVKLIHLAAAHGDVKMFKILLDLLDEHEVTAAFGSISVIHLAITHGKAEIWGLLLQDERFLKILRKDTELLYFAVSKVEVIRFMLGRMTKEKIHDLFGVESVKLVAMAIEDYQAEVAEILLQSKKIEINPEELYCDQTILHIIVESANVKLLKIFIARGFPLDCPNCEGQTALQMALLQKPPNTEMISLLKYQKELTTSCAASLLEQIKPPVTGLTSSRESTSCGDEKEKIESKLLTPSQDSSKKILSLLSPILLDQVQNECGKVFESISVFENYRKQKCEFKKEMESKNKRYEVRLSWLFEREAGDSQKKNKQSHAGHYYYVPDSSMEKRDRVPLYIHIADKVVAEAKGSWESIEEHLTDALKFIRRKDKDRCGIRRLGKKFYEICIKDKEVGNIRIYAENAKFVKKYVKELDATVNVITFDGYAKNHDILEKRLAHASSGPTFRDV